MTAQADIMPPHSEAAIGLICADSLLRRRVREVLETEGSGHLTSASSADKLSAAGLEFDTAIVCEAGRSLLEETRSAREALPAATRIVAVGSPSTAGDSRRVLRAGADGLVNEAELAIALGPAITAVRSGLICVPRPVRAALDGDSLSMREKQVLGMLVMGFTNAEIATKLFLAESTVKSHLSSAYVKLGVRSRKDAATMILDPVDGFGPGILAITPA